VLTASIFQIFNRPLAGCILMKNKNLLSLLETTTSLQTQGEGAEFENLDQELAQKLRGGQAAQDADGFDLTLNGSCGTISNTGCGKG
jgi:hypothetical protein